MSRKGKHPGYKELERRNRNQAHYIAEVFAGAELREGDLAVRLRQVREEEANLTRVKAAVRRRYEDLNRRKHWGFLRRLKFLVTGK